jgi:hypothetical protein
MSWLRALLAVAEDLLGGRSVQFKHWSEVTILARLLGNETSDRGPDALLSDTVVHWGLAVFPPTRQELTVRLRANTNELLEHSGVRIDSGLGLPAGTGPSYNETPGSRCPRCQRKEDAELSST